MDMVLIVWRNNCLSNKINRQQYTFVNVTWEFQKNYYLVLNMLPFDIPPYQGSWWPSQKSKSNINKQ